MLQYMRIRLAAKSRTDRGATAVEYGLLVALIAVGIIAAVGLLRDELNSLFGEVQGELEDAQTP